MRVLWWSPTTLAKGKYLVVSLFFLYPSKDLVENNFHHLFFFPSGITNNSAVDLNAEARMLTLATFSTGELDVRCTGSTLDLGMNVYCFYVKVMAQGGRERLSLPWPF